VGCSCGPSPLIFLHQDGIWLNDEENVSGAASSTKSSVMDNALAALSAIAGQIHLHRWHVAAPLVLECTAAGWGATRMETCSQVLSGCVLAQPSVDVTTVLLTSSTLFQGVFNSPCLSRPPFNERFLNNLSLNVVFMPLPHCLLCPFQKELHHHPLSLGIRWFMRRGGSFFWCDLGGSCWRAASFSSQRWYETRPT
jgi:hypothetical protein